MLASTTYTDQYERPIIGIAIQYRGKQDELVLRIFLIDALMRA